jgi:tetratricopeptide (TPR) repeat protein
MTLRACWLPALLPLVLLVAPVAWGAPALCTPESLSGETRETYEAGVAALQRGKTEEAKRYFLRALKQEPRAAVVQAWLVQVYGRLNDKVNEGKAFQAFTAACPAPAASMVNPATAPRALPPPPAQYRCVRSANTETLKLLSEAVRLVKNKQFQEAEAPLYRVLELEPDSAEAYLLLGSVYAGLNRLDDGATAYARFILACPEDPRAPRAKEILETYARTIKR